MRSFGTSSSSRSLTTPPSPPVTMVNEVYEDNELSKLVLKQGFLNHQNNTICICTLSTSEPCTLGVLCNKQRIFLADCIQFLTHKQKKVPQHVIDASTRLIAKSPSNDPSVSNDGVGSISSELKVEGDISITTQSDISDTKDPFTCWRSRLTNAPFCYVDCPWPGDLKVLHPDTKVINTTIAMPPLSKKEWLLHGPAKKISHFIPTSKLIPNELSAAPVTSSSFAAIAQASIANARLINNPCSIQVQLVARNAQDPLEITTGGGHIDAISGEVGAVVYNSFENLSGCGAVHHRLASPSHEELRNPWFARIAALPDPEGILEEAIRTHANRRDPTLVVIRAPPLYGEASPLLPKNAEEAYSKEYESTDEVAYHLQMMLRCIILTYFHYFDSCVYEYLSDKKNNAAKMLRREFQAIHPQTAQQPGSNSEGLNNTNNGSATDKKLGAWQVHKNTENKAYNVFVVTTSSLRRLWKELLKSASPRSIFLPFDSLGVAVRLRCTEDEIKERLTFTPTTKATISASSSPPLTPPDTTSKISDRVELEFMLKLELLQWMSHSNPKPTIIYRSPLNSALPTPPTTSVAGRVPIISSAGSKTYPMASATWS